MDHQVKNLPAMQETEETWVRSLGWEDPLEEEIATHSSIHGWRSLAGYSPKVVKRHDWVTKYIVQNGIWTSRHFVQVLHKKSVGYTLLLIYSKWITNNGLLHSTGKSAQCYVQSGGRGVWGRMDAYICVTESLCWSPATVTALLISYTLI